MILFAGLSAATRTVNGLYVYNCTICGTRVKWLWLNQIDKSYFPLTYLEIHSVEEDSFMPDCHRKKYLYHNVLNVLAGLL